MSGRAGHQRPHNPDRQTPPFVYRGEEPDGGKSNQSPTMRNRSLTIGGHRGLFLTGFSPHVGDLFRAVRVDPQSVELHATQLLVPFVLECPPRIDADLP